MRRIFGVLLLGLVVVVLAPAYTRIASSTTGNMAHWASMPISYSINQQGSSQIRNESEFVAVHAAFRSWADVPTAAISFNYQGPLASAVGELDNINLISFGDATYPWSTGTLAVTLNYFSSSTGITREADILFNPSQTWSTSGEVNRYDIQAVLTHEIGHFLGLDHSAMPSSVMTPFGAPSVVDQRTLQYDDIAGVSEIYPRGSNGTGQINGTVTLNSEAVRGAHIVAMDASGTAMVGTLTRSNGTYTLPFLPAGAYRVYAEPLDGPTTESNLGGFYRNLNISFAATYFPNSSTLPTAQTVQVQAGELTTGIDIQVPPRNQMNIARPAVAPRLGRSSTNSVILSGTDLTSGVTFSSSNPTQVILGSPLFGTSSSTTTPTNAVMSVTLTPAAPLGPKNIAVHRGTDGAVVSGGIVVVDPLPAVTSVEPSRGGTDGQARVTIRGSNFRPGATVYFGGMPSPDVQLISASVIDAVTPENSAGSARVQVINSDGTANLGTVTYLYEAGPPVISSISPPSGPPATPVTIGGRNFDPFDTRIYFNGILARTISASATRLTTAVPYGATSGPISVVANSLTTIGDVFTVTPPTVSNNRAPEQYSFTDASVSAGGTNLSFGSIDDGGAPMTLPFTVSLFRDIYLAGSTITVTTNGFISLEAGSNAEYQNGPLPGVSSTVPAASGCFAFPATTRTMPRSLIGPFFDDLVMTPSSSAVSTRVIGAEPNRQLIVQWSHLSVLDESGCDVRADLTFQLVIFEGSNDIMFVYPSLSGPRSDGSSATVGMQDYARITGVQGSFNEPTLSSGKFLTYRFNNGNYVLPDVTAPSAPVVVDGGLTTNSTSSLSVSWTADDPESGVREYQYAVGTTPGATNVVGFTTTTANFAVLNGLSLTQGSIYYFAVRAVNGAGMQSAMGLSDGIRVNTDLKAEVQILPFVQDNETRYTGIAMLAPSAMSVTLKAMNNSGTQLAATTVTLNPGQQNAKLVSELFNLSSFEGWVQVEPSAPGLGLYSATGSRDNRDLDGVVPRGLLDNFVVLHPGSTLWMVNPSAQAANVTLTGLGSTFSQTLSIPARSRMSTPVTTVARVTSTQPLAAVEMTEGPGKLAESIPESAGGFTQLTFPDALIGGNYSSRLTLANVGGSGTVNVRFNGVVVPISLATESTTVLELNSLFPGESSVQRDAVRVETISGSAAMIGVIDMVSPLNAVSLGARLPSTEFAFPHVAQGGPLFTGLCLISGSAGAVVTVDVYSPDGTVRKSNNVALGPSQQIAKLVGEMVPSVTFQLGGYIRIRSDRPILAWEIYGTDEAYASGPPL